MSAGTTIEIYKEVGSPIEFVARFGLERIDGTHALGHTRMATESRVTTQGSHPFSTGLDLCLVHNGSLSNHNRLRRDAAPRGHPLPDRERLRGRRRLPDLAAARGRDARAGARGLPRRSRRLLHVRRRHRGRLRRAARPDRVQAGGPGRDRRLGRDGLRVPRDRGAARRRGRRHLGARARRASTAGAWRRWRDERRRRSARRGHVVRSRPRQRARAQRAAARRRATRARAARVRVLNPGGAPRARGRARRATTRSRSTATSATTAPG